MILHLGVIDLPYVAARGRSKRRAGTITTGDVAEILEDKYGVMGAFAEKDLGEIIEKSLSGTVENILLGGPIDQDPFGEATSEIEDSFKKFLSDREIEKMGIAGVPTKAALSGKSKRFKSGYTKDRKRRPSFIDTGLYQSSFKAEID